MNSLSCSLVNGRVSIVKFLLTRYPGYVDCTVNYLRGHRAISKILKGMFVSFEVVGASCFPHSRGVQVLAKRLLGFSGSECFKNISKSFIDLFSGLSWNGVAEGFIKIVEE